MVARPLGRICWSALALMLASPAIASSEKAAANAPAKASEIAPEALTAARPVIDKVWPLGTYRRMMDGTLSKMMDNMMGSMFDMKAGDFMNSVDASGKLAKETGDASMGEIAEKADPHFRERMRLSMDVMMKELIPLMERIEPGIREDMARVYARKFTVSQLNDMNSFFSTPSGSAFAGQSMLVFMEPEILNSMQSFVPDMLKAMPEIMKKAEAATAHLPKPKPAATTVTEPTDEEGEAPWDLSENWAPEFQSAYGQANDRLDKVFEDMDAIRAKAVAEAKARLDKKK